MKAQNREINKEVVKEMNNPSYFTYRVKNVAYRNISDSRHVSPLDSKITNNPILLKNEKFMLMKW